ncbi:unnamed protein product [Mytilus edulis]|uniref:CxC1-like cysteine cluster associated with KDZ transposases domain-containing protein n=1 Tax=Mytilus edulis TaxID=6550 RepID=A0A8S3UWZ7_MYTED|nr:unnamed protein product [Mytilus edulis]
MSLMKNLVIPYVIFVVWICTDVLTVHCGLLTTCQSCMTKSHSFPHLHTIEKWMHGTFIECPVNSIVWKRTDHVACESNYQKELVIVDDKGRQHLRHVQFCSCEQEPITLLRFNLWPASPKHPRLAFHVELLMLLNGLLLESHVSVKSFCAVLTARHSKHNAFYATKERQDLYKILMKETIQEFRHLLYKKEHPKHLCEKLDDGTECPACYNVTQPIVSFDADFQLVRKGSSGNNWKPPNHEGHFFVNQDSVDNFMSEYTTDNKKEDVECNEFQAGNQLRSKIKNKKLSETAVFGSIRCHEFPQLFCSLKHGERLGYSVFLIDKLLEKYESKNIHVMYDIACILDKHLKTSIIFIDEDYLSQRELPISAVHKQFYSSSFNPRKTLGIGLTDGEGMERLWSYLGKFSSITKEMTPENRIDLLTDALIYYGQKKKQKLGTDKETIGNWLNAEIIHASSKQAKIDLYGENQAEKEVKRLEASLLKIEKKHKIQRWDQKCEDYTQFLKQANKQQKIELLASLKQLVVERCFLLSLVKRYASMYYL